MDLLAKFLPRTEFSDYADFKNNYKLNIPNGFNFAYDIIDEYARLEPNKPALVHVDENMSVTRYTFGDISRMSTQSANMFASYGIKKGDYVMMMLRERPEAWITIVALAKLGAIVIPATFQLTTKDIVYRVNSTKAKLLCIAEDDEIIKYVREARPQCETLVGVALVGDNVEARYGGEFIDYRKEALASSEHIDRVANSNNETMLTYFSSGTTGMPKMVAHSFTYPLGHIVTAKYWQHVEDGGLHLTMSDSGWAKFAWGKIFGQWISGAVILALDTPRFDAKFLLNAINTLRPVTFCAPPTIYRFLIKEDLSVCDFSCLHHCCTAGEPLNPEVFYRFKEATGQEIFEGFGQTETSVIMANFGWDKVKLGSTGLASPLYDIDIVDADGNRCEDGVVGSIVIKNAKSEHPCGLFLEYTGDEGAMKRAWRYGFYDTGDMAWRDSDGYFWFEGRSDDVIKCSGYRIGPFEVESALLTHPSVLECAVTAVPDPIRGQVVKATVVLAKGYEPSDELKKTLQNHVKKTTAPYKYPRVLEFVDELPKTVGGKIKRAQIRNTDKEKSIK